MFGRAAIGRAAVGRAALRLRGNDSRGGSDSMKNKYTVPKFVDIGSAQVVNVF